MQAAVLNEVKGTFDIEDIEIDTPIGREVLVEVKASGLCHSDLHFAETDYAFPLPAVFGHEMAGIVKEIGPDVREFAIGDHVVACLIQFCGHCERCLSGQTYQCKHPEETLRSADEKPRLSHNGKPVTSGFGIAGFAPWSLVHEDQLVRLPDALPFPQACLLGCATATGAGSAINVAHVEPGDSVAVIGVGGVGLNVIQAAKLAGALQIIAIDLQPKKEALARKFGATDFVNAAEGDPVEAVRKLSGGGVMHAFEVIGIKATAQQTIKMVGIGGAAYLIGAQKPGTSIEVDVLADLMLKQASIRGVNMGSTNLKHDIPMYANMYLQGRLNLDDLISKEINLSEINDAYAELKNGVIARSVITSF